VQRFRIAAVAIVLAIGASAFAAPALHAQGGAVLPLPQFQSDYPFAGTAQCLDSASATCRRKPRAELPADLDGAAPASETEGPVARVRGGGTLVRLYLRRATVADALAALNGAFNLSYHSSIVLDEELNGTYAGSLRRVIVRLLDGYDYVIKQNGESLDVVIFGRHGERADAAAPSPPSDPFHAARERRRPQLPGAEHQ